MKGKKDNSKSQSTYVKSSEVNIESVYIAEEFVNLCPKIFTNTVTNKNTVVMY